MRKPLALFIIAAAGVACASLSGYDASRYEASPTPSASVDLETSALPPERRPHMLDPRSRLVDAGP